MRMVTRFWRARSRAASGAAVVAVLAAALTTGAASAPELVELAPLSEEAQAADGSDTALSLPEEVVEQAEDKAKIAELWSAAKIGEVPQSALKQATNEYLSTYGATSLDAAPGTKSSLTGAVPMAAASARYLATGSPTQSNSFYCGPAVGYTIAKFRGKTKSADNNLALRQKSFALARSRRRRKFSSHHSPHVMTRMAPGCGLA